MNEWEAAAGPTCPRCGREALRFVGEVCYRCHQEAEARLQEQQEWAARMLREYGGYMSRRVRAAMRRMARGEEVDDG